LVGLAELVQREPYADAYFMCEDDVVFCRNLRPWLERELWPEPRLGVVSLFSAAIHPLAQMGWNRVDAGPALAGAQAYIFPNSAARHLLQHPLPVNHRRRGYHKGLADNDAVVGLWAKLADLPVFLHQPSLAQHIGETSALGHGTLASDARKASCFIGEDADPAVLLDNAKRPAPSAS
jgi:hypothetical protein